MQIILDKYNSNINGEQARLSNQQKGYYNFDMNAINNVLEKYPKGRKLVVLDLGCSNGEITASRFADNRFKHVIGIDYNQRDIDEAISKNYGEKYSFFCMNLDDKDFLEQLSQKLLSIGIEKIDIVFMALTLQHLEYPQKLLHGLYGIFSDDGTIIIRGSDDGGKMCYPKSEVMTELLNRYNMLFNGVTDRFNGRKLYKQLVDAGYLNVTMMYQISDTCGKNMQEKLAFYNVGFSFREKRLLEIKEKNSKNKQIQTEVAWQIKALEEIKQLFGQSDFWYCNTSYIAIAGVQ